MGKFMDFGFFIWIAGKPARADESAVGAINDSVGKIGRDKWTSPIWYTQGKRV